MKHFQVRCSSPLTRINEDGPLTNIEYEGEFDNALDLIKALSKYNNIKGYINISRKYGIDDMCIWFYTDLNPHETIPMEYEIHLNDAINLIKYLENYKGVNNEALA